MEDHIVKRLHVSGLTPALTSDDLSKRLSTFGTVKAVDGFGLQDDLGQPRKFGYVTLETTQGKLSRCLNLLSGSTWKGAKLRIGEAKPDFAERLAAEREAASSEPPKKKRKRFAGKEAADMSLVTPENVAGRGGWKVTSLGRIVKPVRMRPEHPLLPPNEDKEKGRLKGKKKGEEVKKKKRVKEPDTRARRRTIDVTRYGSVHLKGMFLDMEVLGTRRENDPVNASEEEEIESEPSESEEEVPEEEEEVDEEEVIVEVEEESGTADVQEAIEPIQDVSIPSTPAARVLALSSLPDNNTDIETEKKLTLDLLSSIFGNNDDADWVGRESVGSDVDETEIAKRHRMVVDGEDDGNFEVVPMSTDVFGGPSSSEEEEEEVEEAMDVEVQAPIQPPPTQKQEQATKLKDLFAPREEEAGFSLLGHLDLDLELDDEIPFATTATETAPLQVQEPPLVQSAAVPTSSVPSYFVPQLNAKQPLFFPLPASAGFSTKARPKDIFEVAMENKWHWRDPSVEFFRTGTEEDIRKRWEESKVELTKEWKRRWREAGKVSRRRRAGDTGDVDR